MRLSIISRFSFWWWYWMRAWYLFMVFLAWLVGCLDAARLQNIQINRALGWAVLELFDALNNEAAHVGGQVFFVQLD